METSRFDLSNDRHKLTLEKLRCSLCKLVVINPHACSSNNHIFCKTCILNYISSYQNEKNGNQGQIMCPGGDECILPSNISPSFIHNELLNMFTMYCNFRDEYESSQQNTLINRLKRRHRTCTWKGSINDLKQHEQTCIYRKVQCDLCNKCYSSVSMSTHYFSCPEVLVKCELCNQHINRGQTQSHYKICPNVNLYCPNLCTITSNDAEPLIIKRKNLEKHLLVCQKRIVKCRYSAVGCTYKGTQEGMVNHEKVNHQEHSALLLQAYISIITPLSQQKPGINLSSSNPLLLAQLSSLSPASVVPSLDVTNPELSKVEPENGKNVKLERDGEEEEEEELDNAILTKHEEIREMGISTRENIETDTNMNEIRERENKIKERREGELDIEQTRNAEIGPSIEQNMELETRKTELENNEGAVEDLEKRVSRHHDDSDEERETRLKKDSDPGGESKRKTSSGLDRTLVPKNGRATDRVPQIGSTQVMDIEIQTVNDVDYSSKEKKPVESGGSRKLKDDGIPQKRPEGKQKKKSKEKSSEMRTLKNKNRNRDTDRKRVGDRDRIRDSDSDRDRIRRLDRNLDRDETRDNGRDKNEDRDKDIDKEKRRERQGEKYEDRPESKHNFSSNRHEGRTVQNSERKRREADHRDRKEVLGASGGEREIGVTGRYDVSRRSVHRDKKRGRETAEELTQSRPGKRIVSKKFQDPYSFEYIEGNSRGSHATPNIDQNGDLLVTRNHVFSQERRRHTHAMANPVQGQPLPPTVNEVINLDGDDDNDVVI